MDTTDLIKENVLPRPPLSVWWLCFAIGIAAVSLFGVTLIDHTLPEPIGKDTAIKDRFIAEIAHEHLVNLTSIGPRVAGSYENEVLAVNILVEAIKKIAREASPHHRVELDLQTASGVFPITFLDGMNNVYRGVQNVVARISAAGSRPSLRRTALLLNCHFDTVPDSPGASDDGAGCAVLLETMRSLAATPYPLRHDAIFLLNGAEENIMQASHGFITQHKWAKTVRAFINIEACGAGGREVLFQAGPHDPWIMEVYAGAVPHPFASSLAQELFESGLIPGDTDFRIFRDFGKLSGVDLAWSSNGYVYHTALDTADRVPLGALQRTGDNVRALAYGLLSSESLESEVELGSRQPVFFDVLGHYVVCARPPAALLATFATALLLAAKIHYNAKHASKQLYIGRGAWWSAVGGAMWRVCAAHACGVASSLAVAALLHAGGARLAFYTRAWLLGPLYTLPALCGTWLALLWMMRGTTVAAPFARGWWRARCVSDAVAAGYGALLAGAALSAVRSGFLPLVCAALASLADLAAHHLPVSEDWRALVWNSGAALAALQSWYLSVNWVNMFVPLTGRSGPAPADIMIAVLISVLVLSSCSWLLPLVVATRRPHKLMYSTLGVCAVTILVVMTTPLGAPYTPARPQRFMVFPTRRTVHPHPHSNAESAAETFYWIPALDVNTPHSVDMYVPEMRVAEPIAAEECAKWVYCGEPYYLPVKSFIPQGYRVPTTSGPRARLRAEISTRPVNTTLQSVMLNITGPNHVVLIISPIEGVSVTQCLVAGVGSFVPLQGPYWGARPTYFVYLFDSAPRMQLWTLELHLEHQLSSSPASWAQVSAAGHSLFGEQKLEPEHRRLLESFPGWVATTGWNVDLHLYTV